LAVAVLEAGVEPDFGFELVSGAELVPDVAVPGVAQPEFGEVESVAVWLFAGASLGTPKAGLSEVFAQFGLWLREVWLSVEGAAGGREEGFPVCGAGCEEAGAPAAGGVEVAGVDVWA
jgi:hypothetical protein